MPSRRFLVGATLVTLVLALVVIVLGAYVRLSDAGLGCPDWPGCYGRLVAPDAKEAAPLAAEYVRPLETGKAWKEMINRYGAALLGLAIVGLAILSWQRRDLPGQPLKVPLLLVVLVIFQAVLGMWTVTLLLKPLVVVLHLLGGFTVLALLWWSALVNGLLDSGPGAGFERATLRPFRWWAVLGIIVLIGQVALGGWTSSNYAALACPDFPTCHGEWWPPADFTEGFVLWRGLGQDYEFGVLDGPARVAIHIAHRVGAVVTFLYIAGLAIGLLRAGVISALGYAMLLLLVGQVSLGIANVWLGVPLAVAVAHNGVAAVLVLAVVTLVHRVWSSDIPRVGE